MAGFSVTGGYGVSVASEGSRTIPIPPHGGPATGQQRLRGFFLLPQVSEVISTGDFDLLGRMFEFAEWCARQAAQDLWNAAGVVFYEHLFDGINWQYRTDLIRRLSPRIIADCMALWEHRLPPEKFAEVRPQLLQQLGKVHQGRADLRSRLTNSHHPEDSATG